MIQVAFVNANGDISSVTSPGTDNMFQHGHTYGDYVAHHIDESIVPWEFISTKYFDFDTNTFESRTPRPSDFHNWNKQTKLWELEFERAMVWVRIERTKRLIASDWTQLPDSPVLNSIEWQTYRQALRDLPDTIPNTIQSMEEIVWPTPPA